VLGSFDGGAAAAISTGLFCMTTDDEITISMTINTRPSLGPNEFDSKTLNVDEHSVFISCWLYLADPTYL
jgi:hypothetical protein